MFLQTIRTMDGSLTFHGLVTWRKGDEFGFIPQGKGASGEWWCKLDYWRLIEGELPLFKITSNGNDEKAA
ncbi:MAG: hypothetical protein N2484_06010 [Clostridia bacterium]|nr:hypothetical protein [Clostridia bacterium]